MSLGDSGLAATAAVAVARWLEHQSELPVSSLSFIRKLDEPKRAEAMELIAALARELRKRPDAVAAHPERAAFRAGHQWSIANRRRAIYQEAGDRMTVIWPQPSDRDIAKALAESSCAPMPPRNDLGSAPDEAQPNARKDSKP